MMEPNSRLPLLAWLRDYRKEWLQPDVIAGLTTAAVVIPKSMAYATVAGLPIQVGLYTAFVPLIIYAVLGTSRPLSVSTTTTIAILTGSEMSRLAPNGDVSTLLSIAALLALMVGAILVLASALRLGFAANFLSEPVLVGFKAGIGVVIIVDQLPKIVGIHFDKGPFLHNLQSIALGLSHTSIATLAVSAATIGCLATINRFRHGWPAPLIALALAIGAVRLFDLERHGVELVGAIPAGLPSFHVPELTLANQLWPAALGIALMSFTETIAVGRAFAKSDEPPPSPNAELLATGIANAAGSLFGSMPAGGGMSQTAVNRMAGARTQISSLIAAGVSLMTMLLLAPLLGIMPQAALASVVVVYSIGLIQLADFRDILQVRRMEFIWAAAAFLGVMLIGTLQGILAAIVISLIALSQQMANPPVHVLGRKPGTNVFRPRSPDHPQDESFPGLLLLRLTGRVFFLNAQRIAERMRPLIAAAKPMVVVLDLSGVFDFEYSALKMLTEAEKRNREAGMTLWLTGLTPEVYAAIQRSPLGKTLGRERMKYSVEIAVSEYQSSRREAPANALAE